jgi:hypothetical protein
MSVDEALRCLRGVYDRYPPGSGSDDPRPEIEICNGKLPQIVDACTAALAASADVYQRGGQLVTVLRVDEAALPADGIRRDPAQLVIVPLGADALRVRLGRERKFIRYTAKGKRQAEDCPYSHARAVVSQGQWPGVRPLLGITDAPTMRADGSLVQQAGYDAASRLLVCLEGEWPTVPELPSRAEGRAALERLLEPFDEFSFTDDAAQSAFVAALLTAAVRPTLPTAPGFYIVGPTAGAGKTLAINAVAAIVTERQAPKRVLPDDDAEMRKVITSSLMTGDRMLAFDNIPRGTTVRSSVLDNALTAGVWADRILGRSDSITLPFAMMVFLTGNNISCHTDSVRRGIFIHLDPKCEFPETRTFRIPDLLGYLRERRRELLMAALTVLRGYAVTEQRVTGMAPMGSFEAWSARVREALVWLGMKDPVKTQDSMREADEDRDELGSLLDQLDRRFRNQKDGWFRATEVVAVVQEGYPVRTIIEAWGQPTAERISRQLRARVGQIHSGRQLRTRVDAHDKVTEFKVDVDASIRAAEAMQPI